MFSNTAISNIINTLSEKKGSPITYDELKEELTKKNDDGGQKYYINIKNDDDLAILYYNDIQDDDNGNTNKSNIDIESNCRSLIIDKKTLLPLGSQFNKIIYNADALEKIKNVDWNKIIIQKCYEGTMMLVYNNNNKWYVSTRRCLDSNKSKWIKNKSFREMFNEAMEGVFELDELNKDYCYHFILVHYKNKNIVSYPSLDNEYKKLYHTMTIKKYTLEEVEHKINNKVDTVDIEHFDNIEQVCNKLEKMSGYDEDNKKISSEGYVIRIYEGEVKKSPFKIYKLQTPIYQKLIKMKPNNSNIHQNYLELYQKDQLGEFLPYFTNFMPEIIQRISTAIKTLAKEILDLYHHTRKQKNPHIYEGLTVQYKKVLYCLHGTYMSHRKQEFENKRIFRKYNSRSINVHDVYHYLKDLPPYKLRQIFEDRIHLLKNENMLFLDKDCVYMMTLTTLMFGNI